MTTTLFEIYRSYRVIVMQMLRDRKFNVLVEYDHPPGVAPGADENPDTTPPSFIKAYGSTPEEARENLSPLIFERQDTKKSILVFWTESLGIDDIKRVYAEMERGEHKHAIVIHARKITASVVSSIKALRVQSIYVEVFTEKEVQINVTHHVDVPRHILCSNTKRDEILEKYSVTREQIPKIVVNGHFPDAVARYLGARKGQLVKIIRPSEAVENVVLKGKKVDLVDITYRIVV